MIFEGFSANNRQSWADHFLSSAHEGRGRSGCVAFLEAISRESSSGKDKKAVRTGRERPFFCLQFKLERKSCTEAACCRGGGGFEIQG